MKQIKKRDVKHLILPGSIIFIFLIILVEAYTPSTAFYENFLDQNLFEGGVVGGFNSYGNFNYAQKIEVPRGINNLNPALEIRYNSQNNRNFNSFIGNGFEISQYYIERNINYTLSNTTDDFFMLNLGGASYNLIYDSFTLDYHTEVESFFNIRNFSGEITLLEIIG